MKQQCFADIWNANDWHFFLVGEEEDAALVEKEENMKTLIDECKKMLITEPEDCLGGWGLIDADPVYVVFLILCIAPFLSS